MDEWWTPSDWAEHYRKQGWQVVPAMPVDPGKSWKRPALKSWREYQASLIDDETFDAWYGDAGIYRNNEQMGILCGACSGGVCIVDLDTPAHPEAADWWQGLLDVHAHGIEPETPVQVTGGGGLQYAFRFRDDQIPPTFKTSIGVDIRGAGGFAMLPASRHESGNHYEWTIEPEDDNVADAPDWLVEAIKQLHAEYGGQPTRERTGSPESVTSPISGQVIDGREQYMSNMIWAALTDLRRDCPIKDDAFLDRERAKKFETYVRAVKSRLPINGEPVEDRLEREGRGWTEWCRKWRAAAAKWDTELAEAAREPKQEKQDKQDEWSDDEPRKSRFDVKTIADIMDEEDPNWLVDGMIVEGSFGFFYGEPGAGKTFITLGLALSVATGQSTWMERSVGQQGPVLYVSSEGGADLKLRVAAWSAGTGIKIDATPFFLIKDNMSLMNPDDVRDLRIVIRDYQPVLIFIDTVSRVIPGVDENSQEKMSAFVDTCGDIQKKFGTTVIGVHHTARAGNHMRGSSVLDGAADFAFGVERAEGETIGTLRAAKIKADRDGWREYFTLEEITLGPDKSSLFAKKAAQSAQKDALPPIDVCRNIQREIDRRWKNGDPFTNVIQQRSQGRYIQDFLAKEFGLSASVGKRLIDRWLTPEIGGSDGFLTSEQVTVGTKVRDGLRVVRFL